MYIWIVRSGLPQIIHSECYYNSLLRFLGRVLVFCEVLLLGSKDTEYDEKAVK